MNHDNSHPAPSHQHFYLGLIAGAAIGAGLAYLSQHKKQPQLKKHLLQQAKQLSHQLPEVIDKLAANIDQTPSHTNTNPNPIKKELKQMNTILTSNPDTKPQNKKTQSGIKNKLSQSLKSTSQHAQKFFTRAGKELVKK